MTPVSCLLWGMMPSLSQPDLWGNLMLALKVCYLPVLSLILLPLCSAPWEQASLLNFNGNFDHERSISLWNTELTAHIFSYIRTAIKKIKQSKIKIVRKWLRKTPQYMQAYTEHTEVYNIMQALTTVVSEHWSLQQNLLAIIFINLSIIN